MRGAAGVLAGLLTLLLLTACGGQPTVHLVGLHRPQATPSSTPTPTPVATPTLTPTPTATASRTTTRTTRPPAKTTSAPPPAPAWNIAPGGTGVVGSGRLFRYRVEVEPATGADPAAFAEVVDSTLAGRLGWINDGNAFQRVPSGTVEMIVRLATPPTVDRLCAPLQTNGVVSCRNGSQVVLNQARWNNGAAAYDGDLASYRILLVNHEVGHRLGNSGHPPCPGDGLPQPVMMQVYYTGMQGCVKNIWPFGDDAAGGLVRIG